MFTGLVEEVGRVRQVRSGRGNRLIEIQAGLAEGVSVGDSVAVNGCCLTATASGTGVFSVEAVAATLKETTLGGLRAGSRVNLERALAVGDRFGGHIVQGHVDEAGTVRRIDREAGHWRVLFRVSRESSRFLVGRGSVCVDGVSLTIASVRTGEFGVNVIPHTWESTRFKELRAGDRVNVEYDLIVKSVQRHLDTRDSL
jgi:riboflavin synthase